MNLKTRILKNQTFYTSIIAAIIGILSFGYFIIQGHGFFTICEDFNEQQIPFTAGLHHALLDGGFSGWSWDVDLGTSTLQAFSFYELGSPFFWITMLFPAHFFPYIVGFIYILKYILAALFAHLYLKRFLSNEKFATIGGILYAFSGFSSINLMYYHFHDVIVFFPLLLIGLELLVEKKDYRLFIFSIFINATLNYFFFIGEAIFLIIYYLLRFRFDSVSAFFKTTFRTILCGILGVSMAAFIFIPSVLYISQNPRSGMSFGFTDCFYTNIKDVLFSLKGLLLPAEAMTQISSVYASKFYSTGVYIPMFGITLAIAYIIKNRDWLSRILIFCFIGSFLPLFGKLFYLYTDSQMRWWNMFALMMALACCKILETDKSVYAKASKIGLITNLVLIVLFTGFVYFLRNEDGTNLIYSKKHFIVYMGITLLGLCATFIYFKCTKLFYRYLLISISVFAFITTFTTLYVYKSTGKPVDAYKQQYDVARQIALPDSAYRLNNASNMFSMVSHNSGFSTFTSTNANSIDEFEGLFDYYDTVNGLNKNTYEGLAALLGGKYYIAEEPNGDNIVTTYDSADKTYYLMETDALPIGFTVNNYITKSELASIPVEQRAIVLMQAAVVDDNCPSSLLSGLNHISINELELDGSFSDLINSHELDSISNFIKDGNGFSCNTNFKEDTFIYFSVPYDEGFTATINDQSAPIINSGGMTLIKVPSGENSIVFTYVTPGFNASLYLSIFSWIVFIALIITQIRRNFLKK
ncbi:YfhO family protein [Pseudobutyrivibrio sp.]|uniref:YfhO family protein n=1 Tax=Pseudobutyrivibrio sp. TaxID=2014367 RepID=UPI00386848D3